MTEMQRLKETIILTAQYYSKTLNPALLEMYAQDLEDLPLNQVLESFRAYRRDPRNRVFPLPAQIRQIAQPQPTTDALARNEIEKIKIAIDRFGYMRLEEAMNFLGPTAWQIVKGMGGWTRICESDFLADAALIAQARNRAADLIEFESCTEMAHPPLEAPMNRPEIEQRKFEALQAFQEHQASKHQEAAALDIPPEDERKRMIAELMKTHAMKKMESV